MGDENQTTSFEKQMEKWIKVKPLLTFEIFAFLDIILLKFSDSIKPNELKNSNT